MTDAARALVLEAPTRLRPRRFDLPEIGDDDGLLRIEACGLCGTDHEQFSGALPAGFAFVPGHESVGVIETIGPAASERWGVVAGDRVAVEVFQSCRACGPCGSGEYNKCVHHGLGDMYGFISADKRPGIWGGYATHQYLAPDTMLHRVPASLDPVVATLFNPLGAGIRWAATVGGIRPGDAVAILGPGIRGLSALVAAREAGAAFVMVTGYGPNDRRRLSLAREFGANLTVDVAEADPAEALKRHSGGLARVVVDVTARAPAALAQAISLAAPGATIVIAGTRASAETPGFWPDLIVFKELHIVGALGVDAPAYRAALALLASGRYPFADVPRRVEGLDGAEELLQTMAGERGEPPVHGVLSPNL